MSKNTNDLLPGMQVHLKKGYMKRKAAWAHFHNTSVYPHERQHLWFGFSSFACAMERHEYWFFSRVFAAGAYWNAYSKRW